ncbi:MAG: hypothetical protein QOF21_1256 [Actinomycetota bacterium]|jgi:hypothetical protein
MSAHEFEGAQAAPLIYALDLSELGVVGRRARIRRLAQIARVSARQLGPVAVRWSRDRSGDVRDVIGVPLREMVLELGVTFVKLGQLLASSPSISGAALADAMRGVLDAGPAVPFRQLRAVIETDLGRPLRTVFSEFDETPFAAASLAVVHRATLRDGTPVAVKVLRPNSAGEVATDLTIVQPFVRWLAHQIPFGVMPAVPDIIDGLAEQLAEELDLRNEARAMTWFDQMLKVVGTTGVRVPSIYPEASGRNVLTMEFIEGTKVDNLDELVARGIDARAAIESLIESWFALTLCTGVFHGDVHAGNMLLTDNGEVVLLDWGIVGRLPETSRLFFRRCLEGALGDETAWDDVRDHVLSQFGGDALQTLGLSEADITKMIRDQTMMIMTQPFNELSLMALMPTSPSAPTTPVDTSALSRRRRVADFLARRRQVRLEVAAFQNQQQERGELLMMKQLVYFERYGKLFLGDEPLIYDPEVYRALLALPKLTEAGS